MAITREKIKVISITFFIEFFIQSRFRISCFGLLTDVRLVAVVTFSFNLLLFFLSLNLSEV